MHVLKRAIAVMLGRVAAHAHAWARLRETALDSDDLGSLGAQALRQDFVRQFRDRLSAGEEINGGVAVLRPSVNREVRLFDHHYTGDTVRLEGLKYRGDDVCTGRFRRLIHQRFNTFEVIQYRRVAARVLNE